MSQNPNNNPNYNPYTPNPSGPNYPPMQPTAYGGQQPPANPPSGSNPNTPNSGYGSGPYGNPYAPPPPGPGTGPNSYDPYAPTMMSQQPISGPTYPPYTPAPSAPEKRNSATTILLAVIAFIVVAGGVLGFVLYNNNTTATSYANATATARAQANAAATATAQVYATATTIASTYPFSNNLVLNDPLVDNSKGVNWDNDQSTGCFFSGSAYHIIEAKSGSYNTCAAIHSDYTDFTFETEMVIKSGEAGGLLFRADENHNKFYRLSINNNGYYFVLAIVDTTGASGNARKLTEGTASSFTTGLGSTNTLAIVARGDQYSFYVNQQRVTSFTDGTYSHGQIGFDADFGTSSTELVFTNAKVWKLP